MANSGKRARRGNQEPARGISRSSTKSRETKVPTEASVYSDYKEVKPLNYIQGEYMEAIRSNDVIFGIGPAGTGKTFVAAGFAAGELYHRNINKIILTRPNVETGRGLGFLPGELEEKYAPYLQPFEEIFKRCLGTGFYEYAVKAKNIEAKPLGFMRGSTFDNCIVLADEMQNCTKEEMKMLLSRIGKNCKVILSGDPAQVDIDDSGLLDAVKRLEGLPNIEVVRFMDDDIVRSKMCKQIIIAYKD